MSRIVPEAWMPDARLVRIIVHWTAGGPSPSDVDREHYHILLDQAGKLTRGDHSIADNANTADDDYAAHTRRCNTGSIGVALCGMRGAQQSPFKPGLYPLTRGQWNNALLVCADLCERYGIEPDEKHLLMHCEVERFLAIPQSGKWDISVRTWDAGAYSELKPGQELRLRVARLLGKGG